MARRTVHAGGGKAALEENLRAAEAAKVKGTELVKINDFSKALVHYEGALYVMENFQYDDDGNDFVLPIKAKNMLIQSCALNAAMCALKLQDNTTCVQHCTSVLNVDASNLKALFRRGSAYIAMNEWDKAKDDLYKAKELAATTPNSGGKEVLKALHLLKQKKQEAKAKEKEAFGGVFTAGKHCKSEKDNELTPAERVEETSREPGPSSNEDLQRALDKAADRSLHSEMGKALHYLHEHKAHSDVVALASQVGIDLARAQWPIQEGSLGINQITMNLVNANEWTESNARLLFGGEYKYEPW